MTAASERIRAVLGTCFIGAGLLFLSPAHAAPPTPVTPDAEIVLAPGEACSFGVTIENSESNLHEKAIVDNGGNLKILIAGKGSAMTITNTSNGHSLSIKAGGAAAHITVAADGSATVVIDGHVVLWGNSTSVPPGPWMTRNVGRTVIGDSNDTPPIETLVSFTGKSTDVCAALN